MPSILYYDISLHSYTSYRVSILETKVFVVGFNKYLTELGNDSYGHNINNITPDIICCYFFPEVYRETILIRFWDPFFSTAEREGVELNQF